jgi:hypothetical protein
MPAGPQAAPIEPARHAAFEGWLAGHSARWSQRRAPAWDCNLGIAAMPGSFCRFGGRRHVIVGDNLLERRCPAIHAGLLLVWLSNPNLRAVFGLK